ncbi:hypothetical protein CEP53_014834 [Fusarium sp. AF-6]|nr:hypothetical protein CEP53_014834 [Fusarium sp. AF-6]
MAVTVTASPIFGQTHSTRKPISWSNLVVGASMNLFQGQVYAHSAMEVVKTHVAANKGDNLRTAVSKTWARGGFRAFYQGLIPWVLRVEMQSLASGQDTSSKPTMASAAKRILATSSAMGFFRGVVPRTGVAAWATICIVGLGDSAKEYIRGLRL